MTPKASPILAGALLLGGALLAAACAASPPPAEEEPRADPPQTSSSATPAAAKSNAELDKGKSLVEAGKFEEALPHCKAALAADPRSADAAYCLGLSIEQTKGDKKEVEKLYRQAIGIDPKRADAALNLAAIYLGDPPRPEEAIAVLDKALAYNKGDPAMLQNLGYAYSLTKNFDGAFRAYNKALEKEDSPQLRLALGELLFNAKKHSEALPHFLKAAEALNDDYASLATIARMIGYGGAHKECVRLLDRAITLKGDEPEFYVRRGGCKHELKQEVEAGKDFEAALKINNRFQPAHYYLGLSLLAQGKRAGAKDSLQRAWNLGKESPIGKQAKAKLDTLR
jgi:tetratricopeptide (TPR) repeat protein